MKAGDKTYLGDGVYLAFNGHDLVLTTENGIAVTNSIVLEPQVYAALIRFVEAPKPVAVDATRALETLEELRAELVTRLKHANGFLPLRPVAQKLAEDRIAALDQAIEAFRVQR